MTDKTKIQLEYIVNCSPKVLFNRLSTPSGLAEWFAEDVSISGREFTFKWKGSEEIAELIMQKENKMVRFSWIDDPDTYFEFRITQDELTGDVSLIVTDFVEPEDKEESIGMWNNHINDLKHIIGS
ncbi:activator of Hsp90 ATPase homolog 1-like protein [Bacteroidales bacterium 6E]|jgi:uncharacterized protein YndB with AHSA1/START domain|nr:activator of Hsp90 ATPase homolog 1-like protein [Bacteroidales bacterium 6E]